MNNKKRFASRSDVLRGEPSTRSVTHHASKERLLELYRDDGGTYCFAMRDASSSVRREVQSARIADVDFEPLRDEITTGGHIVIPPLPHEEPQETKVLFDDLFKFLSDHVTWSQEFAVGATAYVLATWIYERFQFFGYLQFVGPPGSGKTRSLDVLSGVCYHAVRLSSPTPAVVFRFVSKYHPTLLIDEMDTTFSSDLRNILRNGTARGGTVIRCRTYDNVPECFPCYGPKVYAGQEPITDPALASRIIRENMAGVTMSPHISTVLPETFEDDARALRSRLLRWALDNFAQIKIVDPVGQDRRLRQVFSPLFTVAPPQFHAELGALMERHQHAARRTMRDTLDGEIVAALNRVGYPQIIRPKEIAMAICSAKGLDYERDSRDPERISAEKVGHALKRLGITEGDRDKDGVFYRVERLVLESLYRSYLPDPHCSAQGSGEKVALAETSVQTSRPNESSYEETYASVRRQLERDS